jgi:hypothetical protein
VTVAAIGGPPLLEVRGLRMHFPVTEGIVVHCKIGEVKAVDGIDFPPKPSSTAPTSGFNYGIGGSDAMQRVSDHCNFSAG